MRNIEWKSKNGTMVCHPIYTVKEADAIGLKYKEHWRDGLLNDWVKTDDEHVLQIIRYNKDNKQRPMLGTANTTMATAGKRKLTSEDKECRYSLTGKKRKNQLPNKMNTRLEHFCILVAGGISPEEAYIMIYYEPNTGKTAPNTYTQTRARKLMGLPLVQHEIKNKLGEMMEEEGLSIRWILQQYKGVILHGDKDAAKVAALNKLAQFQGMDKVVEPQEELPALPVGVMEQMGEIAEAETEEIANPVEGESDEENLVVELSGADVDSFNFPSTDTESKTA